MEDYSGTGLPSDRNDHNSSAEEALLCAEAKDSCDWPNKRIRVKKYLEEIKLLLPKGQSLNSIETLEIVVQQLKKMKDKNDFSEPVYRKRNADFEKSSSTNPSLSQLDAEEVVTMYNSVTFLDSILRLLCSSCPLALTDVSPELLKDWEKTATTSSQNCSLKTYFPSYKSNDKAFSYSDNSSNPENRENRSQWSDQISYSDQLPVSKLTKENLDIHQKMERIKYLQLFENDEHLSKFIPSLQRHLRKRHFDSEKDEEQQKAELMTQKKEPVNHTASKMLKDSSGKAVPTSQQNDFYRQMFHITTLENTTSKQNQESHLNMNRVPCQQMFHPGMVNMLGMPIVNMASSAPQYGYTPSTNAPQKTFRFGHHSQFGDFNNYISTASCKPLPNVSSLALMTDAILDKKASQHSSRTPTNTASMESNTSGQVSLEWSDSDSAVTAKEPFWLENIDVSSNTFLKYKVQVQETDSFMEELMKLQQPQQLFDQVMECDDSDIESIGEMDMPSSMCLYKKPDLIDTDTDSYNVMPHLQMRKSRMKRRKKVTWASMDSLKPRPPEDYVSVHLKENLLPKNGMYSGGSIRSENSNASLYEKSYSGYEGSNEYGSSVNENTSSDDMAVFQTKGNIPWHFLQDQKHATKTVAQPDSVFQQLYELMHEIHFANSQEQCSTTDSEDVLQSFDSGGLFEQGDLRKEEALPLARLVSSDMDGTSSCSINDSISGMFCVSNESNIFKDFSKASSMFHNSSGIGSMSIIDSTASSNKREGRICSSVYSSGHISSPDLKCEEDMVFVPRSGKYMEKGY